MLSHHGSVPFLSTRKKVFGSLIVLIMDDCLLNASLLGLLMPIVVAPQAAGAVAAIHGSAVFLYGALSNRVSHCHPLAKSLKALAYSFASLSSLSHSQ